MAVDTDSIPKFDNTQCHKLPSDLELISTRNTAIATINSSASLVSCDSEDTDTVDSDTESPKKDMQVAKSYANQDVPTVFGNILVKKSSDVHFGNKTYIHGPVTIKQIIGSKQNGSDLTTQFNSGHGIINSAFNNMENESFYETKFSDCTAQNNEKLYCHGLSCPSTCNLKVAISVAVCLIFIIILSTVLSVTLVDYGDNQGYKKIININEALAKNIPIKTNIADVLLLSNNLRMIPRQDWLAQPPSDELDPLKTPVPYVIITHTATENCSDQASCVYHVRTIQTFHLESKGWSDIAYNFLVGGDGAVYDGRGWDKVGAHTKSYNDKSIGIAFIGTFNTVVPPDKQLIAAQRLIELGVASNKIAKDYKLFGHRQLIASLSPGEKLFEIIIKWPHWSETL